MNRNPEKMRFIVFMGRFEVVWGRIGGCFGWFWVPILGGFLVIPQTGDY